MRFFHPKRLLNSFLFFVHKKIENTKAYDFYVIKKIAKENLGYKCRLINPKTFNDKINWYKLHDRNPLYPKLIDKFAVKEIVAKIIGWEYIIPTIMGGVKSANDIKWEDLPDRFVLKCNHDSGSTIVCKNKENLDIDKVINKLNIALKKKPNEGVTRARICREIDPSILIEEFIGDEIHNDVFDYKFFCFNGRVRVYKIDFGRQCGNHRANYYNVNGETVGIEEVVCPSDRSHNDVIPDNINDMIVISEKLARFVGREFIRVDLYNVEGKIYFGELTFYPAGGYGAFTSYCWDRRMGDWINLKKCK